MTAYTLFAGEPAAVPVTSCEVTREAGTVRLRLSLAAVPHTARGMVTLELPEPVAVTAGELLAVLVDQAPEASAWSELFPYLMQHDADVTRVFLYRDPPTGHAAC